MTARRISPGELLDLAGVLAGRGAGAGRPRTIELRRAISTAYYALFHELVAQCTADMIRDGAGTTDTEARVRRWVAHSDVKLLAEAATTNEACCLCAKCSDPRVRTSTSSLTRSSLCRLPASWQTTTTDTTCHVPSRWGS